MEFNAGLQDEDIDLSLRYILDYTSKNSTKQSTVRQILPFL